MKRTSGEGRKKIVNDQEFLNLIADRFVYVHGESENVDFVQRLRKIANTVTPNEYAGITNYPTPGDNDARTGTRLATATDRNCNAVVTLSGSFDMDRDAVMTIMVIVIGSVMYILRSKR